MGMPFSSGTRLALVKNLFIQITKVSVKSCTFCPFTKGAQACMYSTWFLFQVHSWKNIIFCFSLFPFIFIYVFFSFLFYFFKLRTIIVYQVTFFFFLLFFFSMFFLFFFPFTYQLLLLSFSYFCLVFPFHRNHVAMAADLVLGIV